MVYNSIVGRKHKTDYKHEETIDNGSPAAECRHDDDSRDEDRELARRADFPWMLKDPDEANDIAFDYVCRFVAELENALYDETRFRRRDFAKLMDLGSFVDWWLVHELTSILIRRHV